MRTISIIAILISFVFVQGYAQSENAIDMTDWDVYSEENYTISYPAEWEVNKSGMMGTSFILLSTLTNSKDQFRENINLVIQDLTGHNITLDQYTEISLNQIKTIITDSNIESSKRVAQEDLEYHNVIYTGKQGIYDLKFEQYYWVIDHKAYVLTLTCEKDKFDNYRALGESVLQSFEVKR